MLGDPDDDNVITERFEFELALARNLRKLPDEYPVIISSWRDLICPLQAIHCDETFEGYCDVHYLASMVAKLQDVAPDLDLMKSIKTYTFPRGYQEILGRGVPIGRKNLSLRVFEVNVPMRIFKNTILLDHNYVKAAEEIFNNTVAETDSSETLPVISLNSVAEFMDLVAQIKTNSKNNMVSLSIL
jgi:hypothetical protein